MNARTALCLAAATPAVRRNEGFTPQALADALAQLGIPARVVQRRPVDALRFCSLFSQESGGIYFWEGEGEPPLRFNDSLVLARDPVPEAPAGVIEVAQPQLAYYRLMRHFFAAPVEAGIHPTAIVSHALDELRKTVGAIEIGHFATRTLAQLAGARGNDHVAQRTQTSPQLMPDLAVAAEQQDGHGV